MVDSDPVTTRVSQSILSLCSEMSMKHDRCYDILYFNMYITIDMWFQMSGVLSSDWNTIVNLSQPAFLHVWTRVRRVALPDLTVHAHDIVYFDLSTAAD